MSTIKVDTIQNTSGVQKYVSSAWANFDQTSPSIRGSGNVSSLTDNGAGRHDINFSNVMSNSNYSVGGMCNSYDNNQSANNLTIRSTLWNGTAYTYSTQAVGFLTAWSSTSARDVTYVSVQVTG